MDNPLSQESTNSEEDASEPIIDVTCNTALGVPLLSLIECLSYLLDCNIINKGRGAD